MGVPQDPEPAMEPLQISPRAMKSSEALDAIGNMAEPTHFLKVLL